MNRLSKAGAPRATLLPATLAAALLVAGAGIAGLATAVLAPAPAAAQDIEYIESNQDWHAFQFTENGNRVCYMASRPKSAEGDYSARGDIFALVTHRPAENETFVFSVITGYTYEPGSAVEVSIDNENRFELFTEDDTAWSHPEDQRNLVSAMRAGLDMIIRGTSDRGTLTTDTYSLRGFTATLETINEACGV
ncbi:MAG: invasion associated locus B family protein [Azospirillaceae bacterium]